MLGRILRVAMVLATVTGFVAAGGPATAAGTTYRVQVDAKPPKGEPWAFLRFFPGHQLTVDQGDVVEAAWDGTDTPHTATFVPTAHPEQWRADHQQPGGDFPLIVPDAAVGGDDDELVLNPSVLAPTAFDCGTSATPCNFDGSSLVNSGFQFSDPSNEPSFFAKVNAPVGQYSLLCLVHPGMEIALSVLPSGTDIPSPDEVAAETASQLKHARIVDGEAADGAGTAPGQVQPGRVATSGSPSTPAGSTAGSPPTSTATRASPWTWETSSRSSATSRSIRPRPPRARSTPCRSS